MKVVIEIPEKMYQKIIAGTYDYGDMNVIIQNGTQYDGRPHGEWNVRNDTMYHFECPFCKYLHQYKDNFCPLCGADMRKEGDTNDQL